MNRDRRDTLLDGKREQGDTQWWRFQLYWHGKKKKEKKVAFVTYMQTCIYYNYNNYKN